MSVVYAVLREHLADYGRRWPDEHAVVSHFLALLDDPVNPFVRERLEGHLTSGCWLVSGDGRRILMTHHRKLDRWLQLGGHADGDTDMARVALKEGSLVVNSSQGGGTKDTWVVDRNEMSQSMSSDGMTQTMGGMSQTLGGASSGSGGDA